MNYVRYLLTSLLIALFVFTLLAVINNAETLDEYHCAGPIAVGMIFFAVGILGIHMQVNEHTDLENTVLGIVRLYLRYTFQIFIFLAIFVSAIWALVAFFQVGLPAIFGERAERLEILYIPAFLCLIFIVIKVLTYLADKGIIGPKY